MNNELYQNVGSKFENHFGFKPTIAAYAPGRVEVLGNHTDYNEGFVLSAAINLGTVFLAAPARDETCRLVAGDLMQEARFAVGSAGRSGEHPWSNYVAGVFSKLAVRSSVKLGFNGMFLSDIPIAAGLSSSAALEISAGLALCALYRISVPKLDLARIGQIAEHEFAGVKSGLLDQISSLFGKEKELVMSDFRSLQVQNIPVKNSLPGASTCFLVCDTGVKHTLVESEYNERRARCEMAVRFFAPLLGHSVTALRDVSLTEWQKYSAQMDSVSARRSAHVIGENDRVLRGRDLLLKGNLKEFGALMFESHDSSRSNFQNSCPELDCIVDCSRQLPGVLGARLSGGGFGGSVIALVHADQADMVARDIAARYRQQFGRSCDVRVVTPSEGARVLQV